MSERTHVQGGTSCGKLLSGWRGLSEFVRTKSLARLSSAGLSPSAVLSQKTLHFCCRNAKKKPTVFAPKTLIYGVLVANVARITTSQLVRCRPAAMSNQSTFMYLIQELFRLSLLSLKKIVNICVTDGSEILIEAPKWGTRSYWKYHTYTVTLGGLMYKGEKNESQNFDGCPI